MIISNCLIIFIAMVSDLELAADPKPKRPRSSPTLSTKLKILERMKNEQILSFTRLAPAASVDDLEDTDSDSDQGPAAEIEILA